VTGKRSWWIEPRGGRTIAGPDDLFEFSDWVVGFTKGELERTGHVASGIFFHRASGGWIAMVAGFSDRDGKARLWKELARLVGEARYDAYVFVGEAWQAPEREAAPDGSIQHAPSRRDMLMITAEASDGRLRSWQVPFRYEGDHVVLEATREEALEIGFSEPIRRIWVKRGGSAHEWAQGAP
jgi:arginine/ornithine N-succinyltransferase beta subunit